VWPNSVPNSMPQSHQLEFIPPVTAASLRKSSGLKRISPETIFDARQKRAGPMKLLLAAVSLQSFVHQSWFTAALRKLSGCAPFQYLEGEVNEL